MAKPRYVCLKCKKEGKGGYFSSGEVEPTCPYCGSKKVRKLKPTTKG